MYLENGFYDERGFTSMRFFCMERGFSLEILPPSALHELSAAKFFENFFIEIF